MNGTDRPAPVEDPHQAVVTVEAGPLADVDPADFQQVESMQGVSDRVWRFR